MLFCVFQKKKKIKHVFLFGLFSRIKICNKTGPSSPSVCVCVLGAGEGGEGDGP